MGRLAFLLLLTVSLSSALMVFVDSSNCVHLRCQWRGEGEHCKPSLSLREAYKRVSREFFFRDIRELRCTSYMIALLQDRCGIAFEFAYKDETDADLIWRIKVREALRGKR